MGLLIEEKTLETLGPVISTGVSVAHNNQAF